MADLSSIPSIPYGLSNPFLGMIPEQSWVWPKTKKKKELQMQMQSHGMHKTARVGARVSPHLMLAESLSLSRSGIAVSTASHPWMAHSYLNMTNRLFFPPGLGITHPRHFGV